MSEKPKATSVHAIDWPSLMADVSAKSLEIAKVWMEKNSDRDITELPFDPFNLRQSWLSYTEQLLEDPQKLAKAQSRFWADWLKLTEGLTAKAKGEQVADIIYPEQGDRRFRSEAWTQSLMFDAIKQSYLLTTRWILDTFDDTSLGLDDKNRAKLKFFAKQFLDALSPTNYPLTNPDVLEETFKTGGENLKRGLENLYADIKAGRHLPNIRMTDTEAFKLGENIATTKGHVVFRNRLIELIHYTPKKPKAYAEPLVISPPWINKYYILDLRPDNSLVAWALEQGHQVFMISWVNPTPELGEITFEDYAFEGLLAGIDEALKITKAKSANVIGYCIGGTLLAMTLAYLAKTGGSHKIKTATFLTTLLDFAQAGDLSLFIDEPQIELIEQQMAQEGVLDGEILKTTFNMLRANDLIWSFVINNYLMGREPFPFDLLSWNSDSTNLPKAMHSYYLRHMYLCNDLIVPNTLAFKGKGLDLGAIETPVYFLSAREDHIAPWLNTYRGFKAVGSKNKQFVLSASGHIAGVVNPPANNKYQFWHSKNYAAQPTAWLEKAQNTHGSWWPHWHAWVSGGKAPTVKPVVAKAVGKLPPAPGAYVQAKV